MELQFKGKGILFLKNVMLYVLATAPVLSVCLMGALWLNIFLTIVTLSLLVLPAASCLISLLDGFSFDDERQAIVRRIGRDIPYERIKRLDLNETAGILQVVASEGRFQSLSLASALAKDEKSRLISEFAKRIPLPVVREKKYAGWKSVLTLDLLVLFLTAAFHAYLFARHPHVKELPQQTAWMQSEPAKSPMREHVVGDFSISLPPQYRWEGTEGAVSFFGDSGPEKTEFKVVSKPTVSSPAAISHLLRIMTGMGGDYADVLNNVYPARFGIIPLVVKDIALWGMNDISIYMVRTKELRGYITQGSKKGSVSSTILLTGEGKGPEIYFFISSHAPLDEKILREIVTGVQFRRQ